MLPKAESAEAIYKLKKELSANQWIFPIIETAKGMVSASELVTSSKKVSRLAFGAIDYCLDLGISKTVSQDELLYPRSTLVVASKAAGIDPPIDTVFTDFKDENGLKAETDCAKQLGLLAKLCIHPNQVKIVNRILTPSPEELSWAKKVINAFEEAEEKGIAAISLNGKMIDYPVYKQAVGIVLRTL
ncbi:citrate lyase subunit beta/citryl-CoA lyase [Halalkalibacter nanhaiisediminis]|uniref:Citrate lyase subunit beta/citryl-CoA lyase n=1 Tax=Halalkalibacter nanhaiisediminis TaxID=688079 RepID=A0A562QEZ4_9BACI|nr:citrate lyase subunit beta/citryl-CoA lyase [Halalkalibacter nanhaiisediminis]